MIEELTVWKMDYVENEAGRKGSVKKTSYKENEQQGGENNIAE